MRKAGAAGADSRSIALPATRCAYGVPTLTRPLCGQSESLNAWAGIVTDYEYYLLYIAEASQFLSRAVDFEL